MRDFPHDCGTVDTYALAFFEKKITSNSSVNCILGSPESIQKGPKTRSVSHNPMEIGGVNFPEKSIMRVDSSTLLTLLEGGRVSHFQ